METITSRKNTLLSQISKLQTSKKLRYEQRLFVGDGTKLLEEAIKWAPELLRAVVLQEGTVCPALPPQVRAVQVSRTLMCQVSQMEAPEGAIFLCAMPEHCFDTLQPGTLILDGIQDPGNLGTILRTADAMDVPVMLTQGCCDPYNAKAVRATMGAIFRSPPGQITHAALIDGARMMGIPIVSAALMPEAKDLRSVDLRKAAVVVGSEGQGVSRELLAASQKHVIIPMHSRCESLNASVAAAILLWEMTEQ